MIKNRFLYSILSLLLLFSGSAGIHTETAVFKNESDADIVVVSRVHHECVPAVVSQTESVVRQTAKVHRTVKNHRKENNSFVQLFLLDACSVVASASSFLAVHYRTESRVLLLPRTIQSILYLQTVI